MGATDTLNIQEIDDVPGWYRERNEGFGLDIVFEMSGAPRAITDAFKIARNGGRVILFGIPSRPVEIDVAEAMIFKNLSVLALNGRKIFEPWYKTRWMLGSGVQAFGRSGVQVPAKADLPGTPRREGGSP